MNLTIRKNPLYRIFIWIAFFVCVISICFIVSRKGSILIPFGDSVQYWAAGKLILSGENPYSSQQVLQLRHQAGIFTEFPDNAVSMMLYPPWSIPFTLPFGIFDYPLGRLLWLIINFFIVLVSVKFIWQMYGGSKKFQLLAYISAFLFAPTLFVLGMGHITPLLLLGIVGFIYFIRAPQRIWWKDLLAGAFVSLVLIKPQLVYLFLFALLLWLVYRRNWLVPLGGVVSILILSLIPSIINTKVFSQYWETISTYPLGTWATPTLGMVFRVVFGLEKEYLQILPVIIGLTWLLLYWRNHHKAWDWLEELPLLLLVGFITTPYGWTYDLVILLIPFIALFADISRTRINWQSGLFITSFLLINIFTYILHFRYEDFWFVWLALTYLFFYLVGKKITKKNIHITESAEQDLAQAAPN